MLAVCTAPRCPLPFWMGRELKHPFHPWSCQNENARLRGLHLQSACLRMLYERFPTLMYSCCYMYVIVQAAPCPSNPFNNRSGHAT
jgi:hypothetical protein